jgi:hypothetical protein
LTPIDNSLQIESNLWDDGKSQYSSLAFLYTAQSGLSVDHQTSSPAPVPTPALLPGLIALGLKVWRRRLEEVEGGKSFEF